MKYKNSLHTDKLKQIRLAGQQGNIKSREYAAQRRIEYNKNPNLCLNCNRPILVSLENMERSLFQRVKRNKFCNRSCGAQYNMAHSTSPRNKPKIRLCNVCGNKFTRVKGASSVRCHNCIFVRLSTLPSKIKSECYIEEIRRHARIVLFKTKPQVCQVCGYSFHADACHIKPIKNFPPTTLVGEINALSNLAALCKNHHDELDKGALKLVGAA